MSKDLVCPKCGQRATYAKDPKTMEPTSFLVCWECGKNCQSCRCKGNVKLQKFGIEVKEKEDVEPIPSDTVVEGTRSAVAALATRPARRRTSPPPRRRAKGDKLERPQLEAFE